MPVDPLTCPLHDSEPRASRGSHLTDNPKPSGATAPQADHVSGLSLERSLFFRQASSSPRKQGQSPSPSTGPSPEGGDKSGGRLGCEGRAKVWSERADPEGQWGRGALPQNPPQFPTGPSLDTWGLVRGLLRPETPLPRSLRFRLENRSAMRPRGSWSQAAVEADHIFAPRDSLRQRHARFDHWDETRRSWKWYQPFNTLPQPQWAYFRAKPKSPVQPIAVS